MNDKLRIPTVEGEDLTPDPKEIKTDGSIGEARIRRLKRSVNSDGLLEDPDDKPGNEENAV